MSILFQISFEFNSVFELFDGLSEQLQSCLVLLVLFYFNTLIKTSS